MFASSITLSFFSFTGENSWQEDKVDLDAHLSTQFIYNPNQSLALDLQRKRLPIFKLRNHIIYLLEKYQTLILVGETGCGKSTQIPQVIFISFDVYLKLQIKV